MTTAPVPAIPIKARQLLPKLVWIYLVGTVAATLVVMLLMYADLDMTTQQC